ncbi:MAG TPA: hypothetical protein VN229_19305 [Terriglobales bacterium]|nr:hypothetical protein [Terriglobales bacterium]
MKSVFVAILKLLWPIAVVRLILAYLSDGPSIFLTIIIFFGLGLLWGLVDLIWRRRFWTLASFFSIPAYFLVQTMFPVFVGNIVEAVTISTDRVLYEIDPNRYAGCRARAMKQSVALCKSWSRETEVTAIIFDLNDEILLTPAQRTANWKHIVRSFGDDAPFDECGFETNTVGDHLYRLDFSCDWPARQI